MVKLVVRSKRFLLASIYQPPGADLVTFLDELIHLGEFLSATGGHLIPLGDFNCSDASLFEIDDRLNTWLSCLSLAVVNDGPTSKMYDQ